MNDAASTPSEAGLAYLRFWLAMLWTALATVWAGSILWAARCPVEVDRDNRERAISSFAKAARQIRERATVVTVYPEGTRSVDGTVPPFKKGPFMLALEAQVLIDSRGLERDELLRKTRLAVLTLHQQAGGTPSPLEPMIAPPGKRSGARQ